MADPQATLGHFQKNSLTNPLLITAFSTVWTWSTNNSTLLQGSRWPSGQNRYNAVINTGLVTIVPSIIPQRWLRSSQKAVKNKKHFSYFLKGYHLLILQERYKPNQFIGSTKSACSIYWMRFVSFLLSLKLPQHQNTVMFKYEIFDLVYIQQT